MHATRVTSQPRATRLHGRAAQAAPKPLIVCHVTRREAALLAAGSWVALSAAAVADQTNNSWWVPAGDTAGQQRSSTVVSDVAAVEPPTAASKVNQTTGSNVPCDVRLDPTLAAAFMQAVYDVVQQQQVVPEQQLQLERFKLQNQEYKYYAASNKNRMPQLPDLADNSGGLSSRLYYNFVSYCLWKTVAKHLTTPEQRTAFCTAVGEVLLPQLVPDVLAAAQDTIAGGQPAPTGSIIPAIQALLNHLQQRGYLCGYQLTLGAQPGTWPADWARTELQIVDDFGLLEQSGTDLHQQYLPPGTVFQVKLLQPADIEGSVALRAEDDGFWSRHISSMIAALLHIAGYSSATADEYFYQDYWQGPSRTSDKLLMLFGDPLQQVEVPWVPTTVVQNWTL